MVCLGNVLVDPSQGWVLHPRKLVAYFMCLRMSATEIGRAEPLQRSVKHDGNVHRGVGAAGGEKGGGRKRGGGTKRGRIYFPRAGSRRRRHGVIIPCGRGGRG